jgi:hypothetical protein
MTTTNGADGPPYDVDYSVALLQQIKSLRDRARAAGKAKDFREALAAVYSQLRNNPRQFGDPLFDYTNSPFTLYRGGRPPLIVFYAVHRQQSLVVIQKVLVYPKDAF